ncbi:phage tail assembly protein [Erwinia amylovora]|uniref:phage tail assembly protein n=1 Tax=Erwinia amylovora TaxID=552 RepID=UPI00144391DD|nr:phage tail assembly protein [Erwinia amylovora]
MLEKTKTVHLSKKLQMAEMIYEHIDLKEPSLSDVEQFYSTQRSKDAMAAMKLLIALVSGVSERALSAMAYTDYRCCEDYLMGFLTWSPSQDGSS